MQDMASAPLELDLQELEDLEAPGFWEAFSAGVAVSTAGAGAYLASAIAVSAIT
nr:daptide-type RiPP [uncultured Actinotalea sp.]